MHERSTAQKETPGYQASWATRRWCSSLSRARGATRRRFGRWRFQLLAFRLAGGRGARERGPCLRKDGSGPARGHIHSAKHRGRGRRASDHQSDRKSSQKRAPDTSRSPGSFAHPCLINGWSSHESRRHPYAPPGSFASPLQFADAFVLRGLIEASTNMITGANREGGMP